MEGFDAQGRARSVLAAIVEENGVEVLFDSPRLASLCADEHLADEAQREASLIADAARHHVASLLREHLDSFESDRAVQITASTLAHQLSLDPRAAAWVTGTFASAMGYPTTDPLPPVEEAPGTGAPPTLTAPRRASPVCPLGHDNPVGASFCQLCGTPLGGSPTPVPSVRPALPHPPATPPGGVPLPRPPGSARRWPVVLVALVAVVLIAGSAVAGVKLATRSSSTTVTTLPPAPVTTTPASTVPASTVPASTVPASTVPSLPAPSVTLPPDTPAPSPTTAVPRLLPTQPLLPAVP